jgi:B12-binding domain/radical SAM domain protein
MSTIASSPPVILILNYQKIGKQALNVIAGALETDPSTQDTPVVLAKTLEHLVAAIRDALAAAQRVVVGWSFYSPGFLENARALQAVRAQVDSSRVVHLAGGAHASAEPEQTLRAGFDRVAVGEGEQIIVDLVRCLNWGKSFDGVRGLARLENGRLRRNGRGALVDLDDFPPFAPRQRCLGPIEITRGCVFACQFCQTPFVSKARFRHRTIENICHYVRFGRDRGIRDYRFITPTSLSYGTDDEGVNLPAVEELLGRVREIIGSDRRLFFGTFPSEVRPEHITPAALRLLKRYVDNGNLIIGGQSGSQSVLDAVRRGHSVEDVRKAVRLAVEHGFTPNVDFLFGLPGEDEGDAEQTRRFARELADMGARIHTHTFMPFPGTPLRHAAPGTVDDETQHALRQLESHGRAYGQWQKQIRIADQLASLRTASARTASSVRRRLT